MELIKVIINNSECQVMGLNPSQLNDVRKLMSYKLSPAEAYFSGNYRIKYLIDKKGRFPTGLLYILNGHLKSIPHEVIDKRVVPKSQEGLFKAKMAFTPYPEQIEAAAAAKKHGRGIISCPTGTGKSLICALIIEQLQVPTLVVVPSLELKSQLTGSLSEIFGSDKVGEGKPIWVTNVDSLKNKTKIKNYDAVIIDEFHHSGAEGYRDLNKHSWNTIYYKIGLTATPFRSKSTERLLLESVLSEVIYKLDYSTAVKKGYIVPVEAYYIELPNILVSGNNYRAVYSEAVVNNAYRNQVIRFLLTQFGSQKLSTICLVKEIAHGKILASDDIAFANGCDDWTPKYISGFNTDRLTCLVGTVGIIGEGVDTKPAEIVIIAGLGKSKNQFMQNVGRGVRRYKNKTSCKIIIFKDASHDYTLNHFKEQVKILKQEYGVQPVKLELPRIS